MIEKIKENWDKILLKKKNMKYPISPTVPGWNP